MVCACCCWGMLTLALVVPEDTTKGVSRNVTLNMTFLAGEPSCWLTWIWHFWREMDVCEYSFPPKFLPKTQRIHLWCFILLHKNRSPVFCKVIIDTEDGPYCEVQGQARLEVLWYFFEGYGIRRLHNFNASLFCFNQITACKGGNSGS